MLKPGFEPRFHSRAYVLNHYPTLPRRPGFGFSLIHSWGVNSQVSSLWSLSLRLCTCENVDTYWALVFGPGFTCSLWSRLRTVMPLLCLIVVLSLGPLDLAPLFLQWASCCPWRASNPAHRGTPEPQGQPGENDPGKYHSRTQHFGAWRKSLKGVVQNSR